ncbi:MAG: class I SAM-dependent methyltransferase [Alphaproteobacteria bacterium]|nr:class I SAM-dependent methyltransferase [Alphaproteobacteria bacterium]
MMLHALAHRQSSKISHQNPNHNSAYGAARVLIYCLLLLWVLLWPPAAQADAVYRTQSASPDGTGKVFLDREIAQVMGWEGAGWLERPERDKEEDSAKLMQILNVQHGMIVADIGAGTGYYSRRMAEKIGLSGKVYAIDIQPEMLALIRKTAVLAGLTTITPVLGQVDSVPLPPASIDLALMVDVYHELTFPREVLASIILALRPEGRIVFVEYRAEDPRVPIKPLHKMSEAQIKRESAIHPELIWERTANSLPWQHVVVFRKRSKATQSP